MQVIINFIAVVGVELISVLQTNVSVWLATQGIFDALKPCPVQGAEVGNRFVLGRSFGPPFTGLSQLDSSRVAKKRE